MEIKLEGQEYIQLNNVLKIEILVESGGMAKLVIRDGEVLVNGKPEIRVRKKLIKGDVVTFNGETITIIELLT